MTPPPTRPPQPRLGRPRTYVWRSGGDERPDRPARRAPDKAPRPANPRGVALDVLVRVLERRQTLDEAFAGHTKLPELSPRDRAFVRLLAATTLRRLGQIDAILRAHLRFWPKEARTRDLLRIGATQLLFIGTPAHAAVGETVALAAAGRGREAGPSGLVNAVLRQVAEHGPAAAAAQDAARLNTPGWLWHAWVAAYGEERTRAVAEAHLREPPLDITVKADPVAWAERLEAELLPNGSLRRRGGGLVDDLPGYGDGVWWVQDAAATLPARLLGDVRGRDVLDLCAAPGGKTAQLAAAGARVTAVDLAERRAEVLRANVKRLRLEDAVDVVVADALEWQPGRTFPRVLLDAPCTATGTIRRHPDVLHAKEPASLVDTTALQARLLRRAVDLLEPGGYLVYAVCSLQPEEGPEIVESLLSENDRLTRVPATADDLGGLPAAITEAGDVRVLPADMAEKGGLDGFYVARLGRV